MKESEFQGWVVDVAQRLGWRVWHVPMPVRPIPGGKFVADKRGRGLPDLIMLHEDPPRLIFAELKGDGRHPLSEDQKEFLRLAREVAEATVARINFGHEPEVYPTRSPVGAYSWRPGQQEIIEAILKSKVLA